MTSQNFGSGETPLFEMADTADPKAVAFPAIPMAVFTFGETLLEPSTAELGVRMVVFRERPDMYTCAGACLFVASGLNTY